MDLNLSEEDQMLRAIAMSLGENVVMSQDQVLHGGQALNAAALALFFLLLLLSRALQYCLAIALTFLVLLIIICC